jgi:hypothetical protein
VHSCRTATRADALAAIANATIVISNVPFSPVYPRDAQGQCCSERRAIVFRRRTQPGGRLCGRRFRSITGRLYGNEVLALLRGIRKVN